MLDLTKGPVVLEVPPKFLGAIDDYWFRWVTDIGAPGGDRGEGGKYLILPPAYDGSTPDGGFFVARARTTRVIWFGRAFLENKNDPKPAAESMPPCREQCGCRTMAVRILAHSWRSGAPTGAASSEARRRERR